MRLYRVTNAAYAENFSGVGASFEDGARWNSPGHPVIYFALDMASALVEAANYHPSPRLIPHTHCKAIYELSKTIDIEKLDLNSIPSDWQDMPYPVSTQHIGDEFLMSRRALMLLVPSVAVGINEYKVAVFNPLHPQARGVQLIDTIRPVYSSRMFEGL